MTFKTTPVSIPLNGFGLECSGNIAHEPIVTGTFAADPVVGNDGKYYGVFTIADDGIVPSHWAGSYRIDAIYLASCVPTVFSSFTEEDAATLKRTPGTL